SRWLKRHLIADGRWFTSHPIGDREVARPTAFRRDCVNRRVSRVFPVVDVLAIAFLHGVGVRLS
ncbi:MAG: hypothetical protein WBA57_19485, partial [Elainellaceae cyanobacterium]